VGRTNRVSSENGNKQVCKLKTVTTMNELILSHNAGVRKALDSMKDVLALYEEVTGNYRPMLNGERYLTDDETSKALKVSRRTLQEYRNNGVIPYYALGGKILYRESDLEALLQSCYHPAYRVA